MYPSLEAHTDIQKYLMPHLQPPSSTAFQSTSSTLSAQFAEADALLAELQESTTKLQTSLDEDREKIEAVVEGVEEASRMVKEGEERWREEMREVRGEVEGLRELVPRVSPLYDLMWIMREKIKRVRLCAAGVGQARR